jgi:hypothetical protein
MNETIRKPLSVIRQEFIEQLVADVNNCPLPLFVIEPILQDILNTVKVAAQQQYEADKKQYEQQLHKQTETSSNKDE